MRECPCNIGDCVRLYKEGQVIIKKCYVKDVSVCGDILALKVANNMASKRATLLYVRRPENIEIIS